MTRGASPVVKHLSKYLREIRARSKLSRISPVSESPTIGKARVTARQRNGGKMSGGRGHAETARRTNPGRREWKRLNCKRRIVKRGDPINLCLRVNRVVGPRDTYRLMLIEAVSSSANNYAPHHAEAVAVTSRKTILRSALTRRELSDDRVTFVRDPWCRLCSA